MVGRTPWSARGPLDPLFVRRLAPPKPADEGGGPPGPARPPLDPLFVRRLAPPRPADEGVGRGPGGPPRGSAPPFLPHCTTVSATSAAANPGARTPEPHRLGEAAGERASDRHFDFVRRHSQRHAKLGPDSQAFADCIGDV